MAQAKDIYTTVGVTPSEDPVVLRFHAEVLRALPGFRAIWQCEPHCWRTGNLGLPLPERVAGSLCLPPDAPPAARAVTHPDVGALFQPGAAIAVCVRLTVPPPMPRPDAQNLPSRTAPALMQTVPQGGGLAAAWRSRYPPASTPSIITAAATAQGRVTRSVIPSEEPSNTHFF